MPKRRHVMTAARKTALRKATAASAARRRTIPRHRYSGKQMLLYHGTNAAGARTIRREGLRPSGSATWYTLTSSKRQARSYARGRGGSSVVTFKVPRKAVYRRGRKDAKLWAGAKHTVYGVTANVYAPRTALQSVRRKRPRRAPRKR